MIKYDSESDILIAKIRFTIRSHAITRISYRKLLKRVSHKWGPEAIREICVYRILAKTQ